MLLVLFEITKLAARVNRSEVTQFVMYLLYVNTRYVKYIALN